MAREGIERWLTTIMSADVVGYSRLMAGDEAGTFAQLKTHRRELIEPKAAEHHGRVVKLTGDGTLMEFASVVDAVNFSVAVQQAMMERNASVPEDLQIKYRIGINLGEVIVDGEDIHGDGGRHRHQLGLGQRYRCCAEQRRVPFPLGRPFDRDRLLERRKYDHLLLG